MSTSTGNAASEALREHYMQLHEQIVKIDAKLDASSDKQGKRAYLNSLIEKHQPEITNLSEALTKYFQKCEAEGVEVTTAFRTAILSGLAANIEKAVTAMEEAFVKEMPKIEVVALSQEEEETLSKERSELAKAARTINGTYALIVQKPAEATGLPEVKARTGSRGPRGKRLISLYQLSINDVELAGPFNNLGHVAKHVDGWKVKDLKEFLAKEENGKITNWKELPDSFSAILPGGVKFSAKKVAEASANDDDDDNTDDDD